MVKNNQRKHSMSDRLEKNKKRYESRMNTKKLLHQEGKKILFIDPKSERSKI